MTTWEDCHGSSPLSWRRRTPSTPVEYTVLKNLKHVFTTTSNEYQRETDNIKFKAELPEVLYGNEQTKNALTRFM